MCGIVGYVGNKQVVPLIIEGLRKLEYRGYDSAGVATLENGHLSRRRAEGKLRNLEAKLAREAGISRRTLVRLEQGEDGVSAATLLRVLRALGLLEHVDQLVPDALPSPIEQLRSQGRRRQRARGSKREDVAAPWTWDSP